MEYEYDKQAIEAIMYMFKLEQRDYHDDNGRTELNCPASRRPRCD